MTVSLRGATVLVVGGTSGIGLEVARVASSAGALVTAVGRSEERARTAQEALGEGVSVRTLNMGDEGAVRALFDPLASLDHVVITAGRIGFGRVVDTDVAVVRPAFDDRFWGVYHIVRHAAPIMPPSGSITL